MDLERLIQFVHRRRDALLALALAIGFGLALWRYLAVLTPFLVAYVLAYVLAPLIRAMRRVRFRGRSSSQISCVLVLFLGLFAVAFVFGLPLVVNVTSGLVHMASGLERADAQDYARKLVDRYQTVVLDLPLPDEVKAWVKTSFTDPAELSHLVVEALQRARSILATVLRGSASLLTAFLTAGVQFMLVPVLLFYFLLEYEAIHPACMAVVPAPYRAWMRGFLERVDQVLGGFLRGQLLIAFLFGVTMTLGLWLIGIRYAVVLGPLSGIANMVPYLGVVVGLVPAFFLALWQGGLSWTGLGLCAAIAALFVVLQLLDGYVFQPRILGPSVGLHPLWIMLALTMGEHLMGLAGMMLAVPVAAVLRVVLEELQPVLYDPAPDPA